MPAGDGAVTADGRRTVRVDRDEFATSDPEAARDFIDRAYGAHTRLTGAFAEHPLRHGRLAVGSFALDRVVMPGDLTFTADPNARVLVGTVSTGSWHLGRPGRDDRAATGEPLLIPSGIEYTVGVHSADMQVVSLDPRLLHEAAGTPRERQGAPVEFVSVLAADNAAAELWRASTAYVAGQLSRASSLPPLAVSGMARLLATAALAVFPNSTQSEPEPSGLNTTPDSVRRAVAYIESNADRDIGVADIADAAGVTPRALQYAFRRHLGTTPLGHLRVVRLDLVHRDLTAANPFSGATVTQLAGRWGFWHAGRFAAQYRAVYGRSPSETLHGKK